MYRIFYFVLYWLSVSNSIQAQNVRCNCENIQCEDIVCPKGHIQLPNMTGLCDCCSGCVRFAELGKPCKDDAVPNRASTCSLNFKSDKCNLGLQCGFDGDCLYDEDKPCIARKDSYTEVDQKSDWFWHADCDKDGYFEPKQCKQNKCFCVDKDGSRIFGSFSKQEAKNTNCACSLMEVKLQEEAKTTGQFIHVACQKNGNFHKLQCFQETCFCVNETTGEVKSILVPKSVVNQLPCYDESNFQSLFNSPCLIQREYEERLASYYIKKNMSYHYLNPAKCNSDGTYVAQQCSSVNCFCAIPETGLQIGTFSVPIRSQLAQEMNCQCLLDMIEVSSDGGNLNSFDCDKNGNYKVVDCHGYLCYCLDSDGFRDSEEVDIKQWTNDFCDIGDERVRECYKKGHEIKCNANKP